MRDGVTWEVNDMTETKLNIVYLPVADIHPYSANPRKHGRESIDAIKQSIEQFGFKVPLQVDKDHVIVNGHGRLLAAKELGFTELPCIVCDDLEARKIRAFRISDNQVQAVSEWDMDTLQNELLELQKEDYDLNLLGFGEKLNMYLGGTDADRPNEGETDADDVPDINEDNEQAFSKRGEIYQLGNHRLVCGDSTDFNTISALMQDKTADMVFTDPPYGYSYQSNMRTQSEKFDVLENDDKILDFFPNLQDMVTGFVMICTSWKVLDKWLPLFKRYFELSNMIIWDKGGGFIGDLEHTFGTDYECILVSNNGAKITGKRLGSVWSIGKDDVNKYMHATQKPVGLAMTAIQNVTKKNDIVMDLFGGSGSTLIACERLDRVCRMVELQPSYADVIRRRWAEFVHGKDCDWQSLTPVVGHLEDGKGA